MDQPRVPRLKDVAEASGVSISAASKILRGDIGRFSKETCERVVEASQQLGWRRNLLVSGIQTGRTKTVGVMIPPYDSFWVNVLSGIHCRLAEADYLPITIWQGDLDHMPHFNVDEQEGARQINRLLDRRVDAIIMWPDFGVAYYDHISDLAQKNVPLVLIDHQPEKPFCDTVITDEAYTTKAIAKHLLDLGHRRIACFSSRESKAQTWAIERRKEFEKAISANPEAIVKSWQLNHEGTNGKEVAIEILQSDLKPTAIFAVSDHEASFVYDVVDRLALSIPEDISVVGFSDLDFAAGLSPPLSTVRQRPQEMGTKAATLVLDRLEGRLTSPGYEKVRIQGDFISRASTGPALDRSDFLAEKWDASL